MQQPQETEGERRKEDGAQMINTRSTLLVIYLACILEKADETILPALYAVVAMAFNATPAALGVMTFCRSLIQALASPIGGVAATRYHRGTLLSVGCVMWGTTCALFALSHSIIAAWTIWACNGLGLALVVPNAQSLTADLHSAGQRGRAFGWLFFTMQFGAMLGGLVATNIGAKTHFGVEGWRFVLLITAIVSCLCGVAAALFVYDPNANKRSDTTSVQECIKVALEQLRALLATPTFVLIVLQGITGSFAWAALNFLTLYLQLLGMSNAAASIAVALFLAGTAGGGLIGGILGDVSERYWHLRGRIVVTQISVASGIPFTMLVFKGLPRNGHTSTAILYCIILTVFALIKSWPAPALNNPVFAQLVAPEHRSLIYAFDRCLEGVVAAFAAPLVGVIAAKWFRFIGTAAKTADAEQNMKNAEALGNALLVFLIVPWAVTFVLYSLLHFTYPKDKREGVLLNTEE